MTPEYFRAMGIPLLQGRYFREDETEAAPPVVIINQTLARQYFPGENPAGKRLDIGVRERLDRDGTVRPHWQEIVGVVGDVCNDGLGGVVLPEIYKPYFQWAWHSAYLAVRSSAEPQSLAAAIRREVHVLNPEQPVDRFRTGDLLLSEATEGPRFRALLVGLFGLVALVLTTAGIYGVLAYTTAERTREVGIRMALGAGRREILKLVLGQGLRLSARGLALGLGISVVVVQLLAPLLYGVKPNDVMAVVSAVLVITVAALAACYLPARRATRIDPAAALRRE